VSNFHIDQSGKSFGRWTLLRRVPGKNRPYYLCKCICGTEAVVCFRTLISGESTSCGCYRKDRISKYNNKHGMYGTSEYRSWQQMKNRCYYKNEIGYALYGGRGIKVCDRWSGPDNFIEFYKDMGPKPSKKHTIDRIDSNGDYCPENCRWATPKEQGSNKRTNRKIEYNGKICCLAEIAQKIGVSHGSLTHRLLMNNNDIYSAIKSYESKPYKKKIRRKV